MNKISTTETSHLLSRENSNKLGVTSSVCYGEIYGEEHAKNTFVLTSDLKHFIDMVYLYGMQNNFLPSYVSGADFKNEIENIRRFEKSGENVNRLGVDCDDVRKIASVNAYSYALIVYGFIKELAVSGNSDASRVYGILKQLVPYKIS